MTGALLIVAHGTADGAGQDECAQLVERVRAARPGLRVELGYLELCPPPIADTIARLAADDVTDVAVVPLVLLAAGHAKGDVPAAVARARLQHPDVRLRYGRALGVHPDLVALSDARLTAAVEDGHDRTGVALIGRGSSDPDANADLAKVARLLWEGRSWALVEAGFVSLAAPSVEETLDRLAALGARHIAVHPYFLFTGVLERRIRDQAAAWAARHPDVEVVHAGHLGPDDRVARLVLDRYDEAVAGEARANCDTCLYRTALPGFEERVGQPQTLHHHPDDDHTHQAAHTHPPVSSHPVGDLHGDVQQTSLAAAAPVVGGRSLPPRLAPPTATPGAAWSAALRDHGDTQVPPGCVDLAVNVAPGPPRWLRDRLDRVLGELAAYPDDAPARRAAAARHARSPSECLMLNGAAEGVWALAQTLRPRRAVCVHPSFTEGERALRAAGVAVERVYRRPDDDWLLDPAAVPEDADLVVLGRPDNPTGVLDPEQRIATLCRPGRTVVVDEAFAEFLPDADGLAARRDLPGLVVLRSLTKIWGLAGLRVGYLLGDPDLVARLGDARQPWSANALALAAIEACVGAEEERSGRAATAAADRGYLLGRLAELDGVRTWPAAANFVLVRTPLPDLRERLLGDAIAVRRGETFPGLDPTYVRVAVRDAATTDAFVAGLARHLASGSGQVPA